MFLNKIFELGLLISCTTLYSQNDLINKKSKKTNLLNEVVVTVTRTLKQISKVPMPVTLVSKNQLQQIGSTRLRDVVLEQTKIRRCVVNIIADKPKVNLIKENVSYMTHFLAKNELDMNEIVCKKGIDKNEFIARLGANALERTFFNGKE